MEKKLTDKEIITALEICKSSKSCRKETGCPLRDCINCHTELAKRVLDLIHRLQSENAEQKAEIERLTKLAELREKDNDNTCKLLFEAEDKNAELQKQVDELSHENDELEYRAEQLEKQLTKAVKDTAKEIIALIKSQPIMQYDTVIYSLTEAQVRGLQLRFGVEVE